MADLEGNLRLGRFVETPVAGETARAFVPPPLPPVPPVDVLALLERLSLAERALGRLDGITILLPRQELFLYMYVRKEAVLSSQIEGTQSTLSDLLRFEIEAQAGQPIDDIREVSNYVDAMMYGLDRLEELPLSLRLIREMHERLLRSSRGGTKNPGEFRRSQNWIGGTRPGNALFVPPPTTELDACLDALERFMHEEDSRLPALIKAGLLHVQFETIHPFLDGNGRIGRLLVTLYLCVNGVLRKPLLYLSLYLKTNRNDYYRLLQEVREHGAWEAWLEFFLTGVADTANQAFDAASQIVDLFKEDRERITSKSERAGSALRVHELLQQNPYLTANKLVERTGLTAPTVNAALADLERLGIVEEVTGRRRGRVFGYRRYLAILSEGTDPLPGHLLIRRTAVRLESVTLSGFRSYGPESVTVPISPEITAVVGPNAAGKTALLHALSKLFGVSRAQRTVQRSDFHLGPDDDPDDRESKDLFIDVLIGLPELADGTATPETIAPSFRHMKLERDGKAPVCRLRLEARWEDDGTVDGEVSQELFWVDTLEKDVPDDKRHPVPAADRGLIQLYYTPASRDAAAQVRATSGALAARLLRAIEWSSDTQKAVQEASESLSSAFEGEAAIAAIGKALEARWSSLHDDVVDTKPRLSLVSRRFEDVVNKIAVIFEQGPDGQERGLDVLSDGQQSLFYFALAAAVFDLERQVVAGAVEGFLDDQLRIPALTLFALEEPENHLSPYFLARIIRQVRSLTDEGSAQAIITSHSPAVLSRINPREVRYCRCDPKTRTSTVKKIKMPTSVDEEAKFVRGAMLAYPELYFARFVLLVEGDSERIVLPRLAEALDLLIDPAFVAIVPLGGRHVQHFWRLLTDLGIPHATLLDLDLGRAGGGFGRIKTVIEQLIAFGTSKAKLLKIENGVLSDERFAQMHTWQDAEGQKVLKGWVDSLKPYSVYFSAPLDLDLAMLEAFPDAYEATIPKDGGPKMAADKAAEVVLGTAGPGLFLYTGAFKDYPELLPAYRYHFLTRSKPATHLAALAHITAKVLRDDIPPVFAELLKYIAKSLQRD